MENNNNETEKVIINVDVVIDKWNKKNPNAENPLSRKLLAKKLGKTTQTLAEWKTVGAPKVIYTLLELIEIGGCSFNEIITPFKNGK